MLAWHSPVIVGALLTKLTTWRFYRGDGEFHAARFDDLTWVTKDVPHDWSAEDLPPREADKSTPVLAVQKGMWRFVAGIGNASFSASDFDDSAWKQVPVPADWHSYGLTKYNATGWFRRHVKVDAQQLAAARASQLRVALGFVASADVTYINGHQIGRTGSFFKQRSCADALTFRSYLVPFEALRAGDNVIAVQAWSAGGPLSGPRRFVPAAGALPAGGDVLPPRAMPVAAAIAKCNATVGCLGISYRTRKHRKLLFAQQPGARTPSPPEPTVFFKVERVANGDRKWQSYVIERGQPGGLVDAVPPGDVRIGPFDAGASPGSR